jgi:hypothetical protein
LHCVHTMKLKWVGMERWQILHIGKMCLVSVFTVAEQSESILKHHAHVVCVIEKTVGIRLDL